MHHDSLEFHNVAELAPAPGGGLHLARFPSSVWPKAEAPGGLTTIRTSNGCEIRFVLDKPRIRIWLRPAQGPANLVHLRGNQVVEYQTLPEGIIHCLEIDAPPLEPNRDPAVRKVGGFSPDVYRIYSQGGTLVYHGMDPMGGSPRPPAPEEKPSRRWLAYGSSITQSSGNMHGYVHDAQQLLEADACNLGMGGSCWVEPAIADFIAERDDWDFASFELGVNMRNPARQNDGFRDKVRYLLDTVTAAHPKKPVFLITMFDCGEFHEITPSDMQRDQLEKDEILREAAAEHPGQVTLIEGREVITDFLGFKADLLHPDAFAYARMAIRLAEKMDPVLRERGL